MLKIRILFIVLVLSLSSLSFAQDYLLADGSEFEIWEDPLEFSKSYYVDINAPNASDSNPGIKDSPFKTINHAAQILEPGERVIIAEGIYRESIHPLRGGTGPDKMISYEAAENATVIVKGSVELNEGWEKSEGWMTRAWWDERPADPNIWQIKLDGDLFGGYNPFAMVSVPHNRYWLNYKEVNMTPFFRKRGMIFIDGKPLEPVEQFNELVRVSERSVNHYSEIHWQPIFEEMTGYAGKFWVEHNGLTIHIRLADDDNPQNHNIEITTKEQLVAPENHQLGYIRVKGITFEHAGNGFPIPQRGLVSTGRGHHWIIEENVIQWANGVGLDIGKEDWAAINPKISGHHIIRNNTIRYIGICGIAGPLMDNTLIENNLIEWIGWQDAQRMWESAAVKFHFANNLLFTNNVVRHIRSAAGIWLDVANVNCRITQNVFTDIATISAAIQIEASHDANQIDHNFVWGVREAHKDELDIGINGVGIYIQGTDKTMINNNFIATCSGAGLFTVAVEDRIIMGRGGTARENKVIDNIFFNCERSAVELSNPHNFADGNLYGGMRPGFLRINNPSPEQQLDLKAWREFLNWDKNGSMARMEGSFDVENLMLTFSIVPDTKPKSKVGPFDDILNGYNNRSIDPRK
jgi:hypothetical protein